MKIVTLNLRHGGADRVQRIREYLVKNEPDVIVLTEFRDNRSGAYLTEELTAAGYHGFFAPAPDARKNRVVIFGPPSANSVQVVPHNEDIHRIVACEVGGVTVVGVYFAQLTKKATLFDYLNERPTPLQGDALVIGDFNTGLHYVDEAGATFACADRFQRMEQTGYTDLWRRAHGGQAREFSWMSNMNNGFRIDHSMGTGTIPLRTKECFYDHSTRSELSDHSALWVVLESR